VDFLVEGGVEMILLNMFFALDWLLFGDVEVCGRILEGWDSVFVSWIFCEGA